MQTIAFFISDHGFGHIMRNIPVLAWLLENTDDRVILVTSAAHVRAARDYVERYVAAPKLEERFLCIEKDTDLGLIVQPGTLLVDEERLRVGAKQYTERIPVLIRWGKGLLEEYMVDKVVVDIVPWALSAAKAVGVSSYLMASFTWLEQYAPHLPAELIEPFRSCFADADQVLRYCLATDYVKTLYPHAVSVGLCARPFHPECVADIRKMAEGRPLVYISIGMSNDGIRQQADVSHLPYYFLVAEGVRLTGSNVCVVPKETINTQDYVMADDYCIAKAGWTTIAEILLAGKPMALLSRPEVVEDREYIAQLVHQRLAIEISVAELTDVQSILHAMEHKTWATAQYTNDTQKIAEVIHYGC